MDDVDPAKLLSSWSLLRCGDGVRERLGEDDATVSSFIVTLMVCVDSVDVSTKIVLPSSSSSTISISMSMLESPSSSLALGSTLQLSASTRPLTTRRPSTALQATACNRLNATVAPLLDGEVADAKVDVTDGPFIA